MSFMDKLGRCKDCLFYDEGVCHRFPPLEKPGYGYSGFPPVQPMDWCGEFTFKLKI